VYLLLEREDVGDAAVDGVAQPGLRLVGDGGRRLAPVGGGHLLQQLGRVAGAEHLVDGRELRRPVLGAEVGSEHALRRALAPQELAGATRRPRRAAAAAGARGSHGRRRRLRPSTPDGSLLYLRSNYLQKLASNLIAARGGEAKLEFSGFIEEKHDKACKVAGGQGQRETRTM